MKTPKPPRLPKDARHSPPGDRSAAQLDWPVPGNGAPPTEAGFYWVSDPTLGLLVAVVEGAAPFLEVRLVDLTSAAPSTRLKPTASGIEALTWLGEISRPATLPSASNFAIEAARKGGS